jgi:hypothetical protein
MLGFIIIGFRFSFLYFSSGYRSDWSSPWLGLSGCSYKRSIFEIY